MNPTLNSWLKMLNRMAESIWWIAPVVALSAVIVYRPATADLHAAPFPPGAGLRGPGSPKMRMLLPSV